MIPELADPNIQSHISRQDPKGLASHGGTCHFTQLCYPGVRDQELIREPGLILSSSQ